MARPTAADQATESDSWCSRTSQTLPTLVCVAGVQAVIRPAAVVPEQAARVILAALTRQDVAAGGVWRTTPTLWQRYGTPWNGPLATRGTSLLIGSLNVVYGTPTRGSITVYRASVTNEAAAIGWTIDALCDEAFGHAGLTLASCPRAALQPPPARDPFKRSAAWLGNTH